MAAYGGARPMTSSWPGRHPLPWPPDHSGWGCRGRGHPSPGVLANWIARATVVPMGHRCREVKHDGTAGLVGCWIRCRRRRHHPADELGRLPRSCLTVATADRWLAEIGLTSLR
jgi:hypothetical protein